MRVLVPEPGRQLVLAGALDAATVADVRLALHEAVDSGTGDLVIDLAEVDLLDSTGLGMFVGAHRRAHRQGRRLVLRSVPPRVERLLLLTRLYRVLHVEREPLAAG